MKLQSSQSSGREAGYAIILALVLGGLSLMILAAAMSWTSTSVYLTQRYTDFMAAQAAAEAATEKVLAHMIEDFQAGGASLVETNLERYAAMIPLPEEAPAWKGFVFQDGQQNEGRTGATNTAPWGYGEVDLPGGMIQGWCATYQLASRVRPPKSWVRGVQAGVRQEVQLAEVPLFQFGLYSAEDLELRASANQVWSGRVHGNSDIRLRLRAGATLTFEGPVTAAGSIESGPEEDGSAGWEGGAAFRSTVWEREPHWSIGGGTNAAGKQLRGLLGRPPLEELRESPMGRLRWYHRADLLILATSGPPIIVSGSWNRHAISVPTNQSELFLTNVAFVDKREARTVEAVELDLAGFRSWLQTNTVLRPALGRDPNLIYIEDARPATWGVMRAVRLARGQSLPPGGLTIVTPQPLYVKGHYNAAPGSAGTTNTLDAAPAALIADAVTVLSTAWADASSGSSLAARRAEDTTVNAAVLTGIAPAREGAGSGAEDALRLLEDWTGRAFTWNGSLAIGFASHFAPAAGAAASDICAPPERRWRFDENLRDPGRLPAGTPLMRMVVRRGWMPLGRREAEEPE
ncbi:MAG TPA: hypothetical protein P5555_14815 [Candidatus Paceibacterota bacterium]|nr:hypothetical protein [Verrucomicrobiota bacterium]HOX03564.1 hypothetical protein [Verrucomicrobiota bacterium]HRZ46453.1 hypothetical protein [Candidatus Paceibacterota bacterium]